MDLSSLSFYLTSTIALHWWHLSVLFSVPGLFQTQNWHGTSKFMVLQTPKRALQINEEDIKRIACKPQGLKQGQTFEIVRGLKRRQPAVETPVLEFQTRGEGQVTTDRSPSGARRAVCHLPQCMVLWAVQVAGGQIIKNKPKSLARKPSSVFLNP